MRARLLGLAAAAERRPWLAAGVLALVFWSLTLLAFTPVWQDNDDPLMGMIAAGNGIALHPDPYLVFPSSRLGALLCSLYRSWPGIPWYGLHLLLLLLAAEVALLRAALLAPRAPKRLGMALAVLATTGLYAMLALQFSTTAFLASVAGLTLASSAALAREARSSPADFALAAALVCGGWLVRWEGLALAIVACAPALAVNAWQRRERRRRLAAVLLLVVAPALCLGLVDRRADAASAPRQDYQRFLRELRLLVNLRTLSYTPQSAPAFAEVGWSRNDLLLLHSWFFADPEVFSTEHLARMNRADAEPGLRRLAPAPLPVLLHAVLLASLLPLVLACPLLLWLASGDRWRQLALLVSVVLGLGGMYAATALGHAPERVIAILLSFPAATALLLAEPEAARRRAVPLPLLLAALIGAGLGAGQEWLRGAAARQENEDLRRSIALLQPTPDRLYVAWAGAFPYEALLPLENREYLAGLRLFALGWPQRMPIAIEMLRSFGIDDVFTALHSRGDVRLIAFRRVLPSLIRFGLEHRRVRAVFELEAALPAFRVYRGRTLAAADAAALNEEPAP